MARKSQGHSVAHRGKRVQVVLFTGASFVAKFKRKEGAYHEFFDHDKVRSDKVDQLRILPTDANPISYRQELKQKEAKKLKAAFEKGDLKLDEFKKRMLEIFPHATITVKHREK